MHARDYVRDRIGLYPPVEPYMQARMAVTGGHELYYEQSGNPNGIPVLVVHGGPGGGSNPTMRRCHDPARYRIILFDQRGCGRSTPHASLEHNTTWDLVADMERIRERLGIERWQLFGGSWGSTLSLAYAETHPDRVSSIILRGVFLLREAELRWFYTDGASWLFPDAFERYQAEIPPDERGDMIAAYYRRLTHSDRAVRSPPPRPGAFGRARPSRSTRIPTASAISPTRSTPSPSPASSATTSTIAASSIRTANFSRTRTASPTSPASSCMAATTPARRSATPGICIRHGQRRSCAWCRTLATP